MTQFILISMLINTQFTNKSTNASNIFHNQTYNNTHNHIQNSINYSHILEQMQPGICQHAARLKNCSNILRMCQTYNIENREECLETALYLSSDQKYYRGKGYDWKLYFSLHYKTWIIQNCKNGVNLIASYNNATCPHFLPYNLTWTFQGEWGKSLPPNYTKFIIEDDSLYDWKSKLLHLSRHENKLFIIEDTTQLETINTHSIIPLEDYNIQSSDTPLQRLLKRINTFNLKP